MSLIGKVLVIVILKVVTNTVTIMNVTFVYFVKIALYTTQKSKKEGRGGWSLWLFFDHFSKPDL